MQKAWDYIAISCFVIIYPSAITEACPAPASNNRIYAPTHNNTTTYKHIKHVSGRVKQRIQTTPSTISFAMYLPLTISLCMRSV